MLLGDVSSRTRTRRNASSRRDRGKAWLATGAVVLAIVQVLTASRMWGKLQRVVPLSFATSRRIHRWSGRIALLLTLPVFFHCVTILGFRTPDARVAIHSIAGSFVYGVVAAKLLVIRWKGYPALGASGARRLARRDPRDAVADVELLVLHERPVRLLMASAVGAPLVVLVVVSLAVFGLAKWHPFSPVRAGGGDRSDGERRARSRDLRDELRRLPRRRRDGRRRPTASRQRADRGRGRRPSWRAGAA